MIFRLPRNYKWTHALTKNIFHKRSGFKVSLKIVVPNGTTSGRVGKRRMMQEYDFSAVRQNDACYQTYGTVWAIPMTLQRLAEQEDSYKIFLVDLHAEKSLLKAISTLI